MATRLTERGKKLGAGLSAAGLLFAGGMAAQHFIEKPNPAEPVAETVPFLNQYNAIDDAKQNGVLDDKYGTIRIKEGDTASQIAEDLGAKDSKETQQQLKDQTGMQAGKLAVLEIGDYTNITTQPIQIPIEQGPAAVTNTLETQKIIVE